MKCVTIFANCQGEAIEKNLISNQSFSSNYYFLKIPFVQDIRETDLEDIQNKIKKSHYVIYQHVDKTSGLLLSSQDILNMSGNNCVHISIPSIYYNGYFPHLSTMQNVGKGPLNLVHDYFIAACYSKGKTVQETIEIINYKNLYTGKESAYFHRNSIKNLKRRELANNSNITISDFIEDNYKNIKLFNQFNHPTKEIFIYLTEQILKKLSCEYLNINTIYEPLNGIIVPTYPSTYYNLDLKFQENFHIYKSRGGRDIQQNIIQKLFELYNKNPINELIDGIEKRMPFTLEKISNI